MRPSITNRVANSTITLPGAFVLGAALWTTVWRQELLWVTLATAFTAYVLMEMNNRNALIRVRTRSMASLFWLGAPLIYIATATHGGEAPAGDGAELSLTAYGATPALLAAATFELFTTYGKVEPVTSVFHCFVALGAAVCFCPPLVVCVPAFLIYLIIYMNVWSARVFSAALLGLMLVATCAALLAATGAVRMETLLPTWQQPSLTTLTAYPAWIVPLAAGLAGMGYFLSHNYDDKIQVRMMNYVIVCQWALTQLLVVLMPSWMRLLAPVSWLFTAPLVAYQLSLSDSRWTTSWALMLVSATVALMVCRFAL